MKGSAIDDVGHVEWENIDGLGVITLKNDRTKNALDLNMRRELASAVEKAEAPEVRAVIIAGYRSDFCAGGDLNTLRCTGHEDVELAALRRDRLVRLQKTLKGLMRLEKPVIAAVSGVAFGAGLGLALTADFIIADETARFCAAFGRVGAIPDCGVLWSLPRAVGLQRAKELIYTAREIGGREAFDLGLVSALCKSRSALMEAEACARRLMEGSSVMFSITKEALNVSQESGLESMLALEASGQGIALATKYHIGKVDEFVGESGRRT